MDRQLAERMVGAACLLLVVVLVVPSILDGNRPPESGPRADDGRSLDLRTHTINLDGAERSPPVPRARTPAVAEVPTVAAVADEARPSPEPADAVAAEAKPAPGVPAAAVPASPPPVAPPVKAPEPARPAEAGPAAQTDADAAQTSAPPANGDWYVQLGSFSKRANAERLVADVSRRGFAAGMAESSGSRGPMYRVRVGPAGSREAAADLARKLAGAGFAGQVTRR